MTILYVRSANILLDEALTAKVSDYGITRAVPSNDNRTWTSTSVIIGTTVYMAPEYLTSGRVSDKIDAYSYGVVSVTSCQPTCVPTKSTCMHHVVFTARMGAMLCRQC